MEIGNYIRIVSVGLERTPFPQTAGSPPIQNCEGAFVRIFERSPYRCAALRSGFACARPSSIIEMPAPCKSPALHSQVSRKSKE